jgi:predicted nucleic acid-binding protein
VRLVLDTNVLMSGLFWRGTPARLLDGWRDRRFDLLISPDVYSEDERVIRELHATRPEKSIRDRFFSSSSPWRS